LTHCYYLSCLVVTWELDCYCYCFQTIQAAVSSDMGTVPAKRSEKVMEERLD